MSDKLNSEVQFEFSQLTKLLVMAQPLVGRSEGEPPGPIEVMAAGTLLHSFYSGIENLFKRIAIHTGRAVPTGPSSHQELLDEMGREEGGRTRVISSELHIRLAHYMKFRHVFRLAYAFDLDWSKMQPMVEAAPRVLADLKGEIGAFLKAREARARRT